MKPASFREFAAAANADGYDETLVREWGAGVATGSHTHPFHARLYVARGALVLTMEGRAIDLKPGDGCEIPRDLPHAEDYGAEGATLWVGRANGEAPRRA
jgi:mannose-6-phosphate isomerase-like protein (cupin superfamily)